MSKTKGLTPMMAQYRRIRSELPKDSLLLFRLGDFYELFFEDAMEGAGILEVALTRRGVIPMCGIPYHAADNYLHKLLRAGRKVAICEQVEEGSTGRIFERRVTQILSPGAHFDESILQSNRNNYLVAVCVRRDRAGVASLDLTTGEFGAGDLPLAELREEIERLAPAEVICPEGDEGLRKLLGGGSWILGGYEDWAFLPDAAGNTLREHYGVTSLDGFGLSNCLLAVAAGGAAVHYLTQHLRRDIRHLRSPERRERGDHLILDPVTLRNLEVLEPLDREAPRSASLFGTLDCTVTPMGARCLRRWLSRPLARPEAIRERQEIVALWVDNPGILADFRTLLGSVRDLERATGRLSAGYGNARDLLVVRNALREVPRMRRMLVDLAGPDHPSGLDRELHELPELVALIERAVEESPPVSLREGGIIRNGYHGPLDELRQAGREGKDWIDTIRAREIGKTGISNLKIRYNAVIGYHLEVTRGHLGKVPDHYIRKQTLTNVERFHIPEIKEVEGRILGAEERAHQLEYELFQGLVEQLLGQLEALHRTAAAMARLDCLSTLGEIARLRDYCRPDIGTEGILDIREGRHPFLEQVLVEEPFVPNDAALGGEGPQIALITGPNMAGKSTYIRQVALLCLLAHTGSFLPARSARIDLVDRIFTRIGASDHLSRGQSTFMVEMSETANILNHATERSLVVLDEVGRGTSTFDGLSLAWSILEHLHNRIGAKTLFATHYHELTTLSERLDRLGNYQVSVREWKDRILFVRKILPGGADRSYGIQVARLAGIPAPVLDRAGEILSRLEKSDLALEEKKRGRRPRRTLPSMPSGPDLFTWSD